MLAILVLLSAMPDTMAAPVVKEILVDRYGAYAQDAQVFNAINLLGALVAMPLLAWSRQRISPERLVAIASLADALLLWSMACPLGLSWTLALRALEGVTDVMVFAGLFDLVRRASALHVARGLGIASTPLLLGLGSGAVAGGAIVRSGDASASAAWVFGVSGLLSVAVALAVLRAAGTAPAGPRMARPEPSAIHDRRPLWPGLAMAFADRATGGLITGTLPVALAQVLGHTATTRGMVVGLPLLLMALGAGPAGWLCDRFGPLRVRMVSGIAYACAFAALPIVSSDSLALGATMTVVGLAGSALFASSLALVVGPDDSTLQLGAFRGAGDLGFLCGTALCVVLLHAYGGESPSFDDYRALVLGFAAFHAVTTLIGGSALALDFARRRGANRQVERKH